MPPVVKRLALAVIPAAILGGTLALAVPAVVPTVAPVAVVVHHATPHVVADGSTDNGTNMFHHG